VARSLIEEDRLLYTVQAIENDCNIVPQGAFRLTEDHEVCRNVAFKGLSDSSFTDLAKYAHFRNVQDERKKEKLLEDDAIFIPNFLDDVIHDQPQGCWSVQKDTSGRMAIMRNFSWAGYTAYHCVNSADFGGVYVGDGLRNDDLPFMM